MIATGPHPVVFSILAAVAIVPILIFAAWVRQYYQSMWYELREDEISGKRGVWFRTTGIVPGNRITAIDIRQGPVMRQPGISTLCLQTASYSGQQCRRSGSRDGAYGGAAVDHPLACAPVRTGGDGTGGIPARSPAAPKTTGQDILEELVKIRQLREHNENR